jgi:hypothetical protein
VLADRWTAEYFDGRLSADAREQLLGVDGASPAVLATIDRALRLLREASIDATDITATLTWQVGALIPGLHPDAWGSIVPPITNPGRLRRLDEYLLRNPWHTTPSSRVPVLLDVGCGFPPHTAIDSARKLAGWRIIGMDRSFAHYLIEDDTGYASFDAARSLRYFQPKAGVAVRWDEWLRTRETTTRRFTTLLEELLSVLPADDDTHQAAYRDGARIVRHPVRGYECENLQFVQCAIGDSPVAPESVDVVRCMNVLMYFDRDFRQRTLRWAESLLVAGGLFVCGCMSFSSTFARYTVYQKVDGRMAPREFAFSVDNIRPAGFMPCYAFHDDDADVLQLARATAVVRGNAEFRRLFDSAADAAFAAAGVARRLENGYLRGSANALPTGELSKRTADLADRLRKSGAGDWAVDALRQNAIPAWLNCVGDIAVPVVEPEPLPPSPILTATWGE